MELSNSFRLEIPIDDAWNLLTGIEHIAPCMPGAQLEEVEGDEYRGTLKVKVGPITARYRGSARIKELDEEAHRATIVAEGREVAGQGSASATITATLTAADGATDVRMETELHITGKVAQFGRGMLGDVSSRLVGQFAGNLQQSLVASDDAASESGAPGSATTPTPTTGTDTTPGAAARDTQTTGARRVQHPEPEPVDLFDVAGAPVAKRVVPPLAGLVAVLLVWRWRRRR